MTARPLTPPPRRRRELVAWFPHEQPNRPADSWTVFCLGACPRCHATAKAATAPDGDGEIRLDPRSPITSRILTRTRPARRRHPG